MNTQQHPTRHAQPDPDPAWMPGGILYGLHPDAAAQTAHPDPAAVYAAALANAYERENDLLNQVSNAHSNGWATAITEALAHVGAARAAAAGRQGVVELAGLERATGILEALAAKPPAPSLHHLAVGIVPGVDGPEYRVRCHAAPGAPCRLACAGSMTGDCTPEQCAESCDGSVADAGQCLAESWLEGPDYLFAAYAGPARPLECAPIAVRYEDGGWSWLYAADLSVPEQEWARAS